MRRPLILWNRQTSSDPNSGLEACLRPETARRRCHSAHTEERLVESCRSSWFVILTDVAIISKRQFQEQYKNRKTEMSCKCITLRPHSVLFCDCHHGNPHVSKIGSQQDLPLLPPGPSAPSWKLCASSCVR